MPKTVSWNKENNIRYIECVGRQKKVRRHKRMASQQKKLYDERISDLEKTNADLDNKNADLVKKTADLVKTNADLEKTNADLVKKTGELKNTIFELKLAATTSPSRKESDTDPMNTSGSSTGSNSTMGNTSS
jgi:peptidoglycan hydrolase CwlO-like protein